MSFGQSFQVTPMQMATTVCSLVNGGKRITPHFGIAVYDAESGEKEETISYGKRKRILSKETSEKMRKILETVVSEGGGKKHRSKDTGSEERQRPARRCQEVRTVI